MRILVLEDDPIIATDLKKICESELHEAKAVSGNFEQTDKLISEFQPNLFICDFRLTENLTSPEILNKIIGATHIHVIFITAYYDSATITEINQMKPDGYLIKPFRVDQVIALIRRVNLLHQNREEAVTRLGLSVRELEVLVMLARGFTSVDISKALGISSHTIDTHRRTLLRKTGSVNSVELIHISRELNLI
jgi:DNA-binding NarL/FixJ family response regulator